jgi:hypothetical protein
MAEPSRALLHYTQPPNSMPYRTCGWRCARHEVYQRPTRGYYRAVWDPSQGSPFTDPCITIFRRGGSVIDSSACTGTSQRARRPTVPRLGTAPTPRVAASACRGHGRQRSGREPVEAAGPRGRSSGPPAPLLARCPPPVVRRAAGALARAVAARRRHRWLSRPRVAPRAWP